MLVGDPDERIELEEFVESTSPTKAAETTALSRSPPVRSVAAPSTAARIVRSTRCASVSEITGPSPVAPPHRGGSLDCCGESSPSIVGVGNRHRADDLAVERVPHLLLALGPPPLAGDVHLHQVPSSSGPKPSCRATAMPSRTQVTQARVFGMPSTTTRQSKQTPIPQ